MEERQRLRMAAYRAYSTYDAQIRGFRCSCPWCGERVQRDAFDLHEAIVKRSAVPKDRQHLIFVLENSVCLHHLCHMEHGNSKEMKRRCLPVIARTHDASKVGEWYAGLWREHELSVPKGILLGRKEISIVSCLDSMRTGAQLHEVDLPPDDAWQIEAGSSTWDFRVLVAWRWQGHSRKSKKRVNFRRPPVEYAGVKANQLAYLLDEGRWFEYICSVSGFSVEEVLTG